LCGNTPGARQTEHFYFTLSLFQEKLECYLAESTGWRENAVHLTKRYLKEGLLDRAVTRDLPWGIDVPVEGFEGKKIYVWLEAVCGYLTASMKWASANGKDWRHFWMKNNTTAYYVHGKDNIPFHTLIWPAILSGVGHLHLPDRIISSEYLTLEGKKFSTSRNWAVWLPDLLERYDPDTIRYFLMINGPEKRDSDFSWREFIYSHNSELLGAFGNFVNRNLSFIQKFYGGSVPDAVADEEIRSQVLHLYVQIGVLIEEGKFKEALETIFAYVRRSNKYFDERKPWSELNNDPPNCSTTLVTCIHIIANLSNLLEPFLPFTCEKIRGFLGLNEPSWGYTQVPPGQLLPLPELLFQRIDLSRIQEEVERLG
jgi:methionyl-tRNA synthetase